YQLYYHVPYLGGSTSKLKTLVEGASTSPRQFVFRGDSQESIPGSGEVFIQELNRIAFRRYGQPRYSPWMTTGTFLENALWLTGTEDAGATQTADEPIPGFRVWNQDATTTGSLWTLYPDAGSEGNPRDGNYFSTNALEFEVLLRRNTANTAEECEIIAYSTENPRTYRFGSSGGFTTHNEVASTGLNLNSADNEYVTFNSGLLSYDNARPYNSVYIRGLVGGAAVADSNMNFVSARWIASDRNSGLTWNTWSQGGYEVTNHTGDHPDLAVIVQALGGYPFDAVIHSLGANDAGSSLNTPSAWKTSTEAMISNTRTVFGADQFIILISEPPRRDYGGLDTQLTDNFNRYAAVLYEAAEADGNCVFLNLGRMLYEVDPDFGLPSSSGGTYLQDTVHLNDASQSLAAEKIYELIDMI
ncbi:MAG: SGNH/GDSL hydrolase family protein, partial [Cyanobacteria bacterium J06642_11]